MTRALRRRAAIVVAVALAATASGLALAQPLRVAIKNGESVDLGPVYWVASCRSIMLGLPQVEILEGPPGLSISIRQEKVLARRQNCPTPIDGGTLVLTAKDVTEPAEAKLTYRIKYKTKDGDRVRGNVYLVSLFPDAAPK